MKTSCDLPGSCIVDLLFKKTCACVCFVCVGVWFSVCMDLCPHLHVCHASQYSCRGIYLFHSFIKTCLFSTDSFLIETMNNIPFKLWEAWKDTFPCDTLFQVPPLYLIYKSLTHCFDIPFSGNKKSQNKSITT